MSRLDQTCDLPMGTRDAVHVPIAVAQIAEQKGFSGKIEPGDWVKFVDADFTRVVKCEKNEAHGLANPFIEEISSYDNFVVFLTPGITTPVRHSFNIDPAKKEQERKALEMELELTIDSDPEKYQCADCWKIVNNRIVRM
jgi:hypothetical protein